MRVSMRNTDQHRTAKKYRQVETFGDVMSRRRLSWRGQGERKDYTDLVGDDGFSISMFWYMLQASLLHFLPQFLQMLHMYYLL